MSPTRWIEEFNSVGIFTKATKYGGTYAHQDIAFKFASWISTEFEFYLIKEFQRLKISGTKGTWMECEKRIGKAELSHSYGCY